MTTANKITILRMILVPVLVILMYLDFPGHVYWALAVFIIASISDFLDRKYRHGMGPNASFAYRLKCDGVKDAELAVTYWSRDGAGRVFDILVDGTPIARESLAAQPGAGRFCDKAYAIPGSVLKGKKTIEVRFSGTTGTAYVGGVFGVKLLRK